MGIGIAIGNRIGRHGSQSLSSYWTQQSEVLFFAYDSVDILNKVVGGQLPNQKSGATDYLTVTGSGLNARYRTPNTAAYKNADTDYAFWKIDASESTCDGNRLIAYDFTGTIVYYDDVSPYTIREIMILSSNVDTPKMRNDFHLSIWWNNVSSLYGYTKGNRSAEQSIWIPTPASLALTVLSCTSIKVDFIDWSANEDGFKIERSTTDESNYAVVHTNAAGVVTWTDTTNSASTKYYYRVRAYKGTSYSGYCASANATTSSIAYLLKDTFTDTNRVHLNAHTMDVGAGWTESAGSWTIQSNKAVEATSTTAYCVADATSADMDVSIDVICPVSTSKFALGLTFRHQDTTHKWSFWLERDTLGTTYAYLLLDVVSKGTANVTNVDGETGTLRITAKANVINAYWKGALVVGPITDATYNDKTKCGMVRYIDGVQYFDVPEDNLIVITL